MINKQALFVFGVQHTDLLDEEINWLRHPLCAGVILFSRNYENKSQIKEFIKLIRDRAEQQILIAVDHEGGRVQRFKHEFTHLPAMAELGKIYDTNPEQAFLLAEQTGFVLAYELAEIDVDFSFAPVLDIQNDISNIIANRAFHANPNNIALLAGAFYKGVAKLGMACVGKHFPGHGNVAADSHIELPTDLRDKETIFTNDLAPFKYLIEQGIEAIMPAHVLYPNVDGMPSGFSNYWLEHVLRQQLGFDGCIISDDLDMAGAAALGDINSRINLARQHADLILLCNNIENIRSAFANNYDFSTTKVNNNAQQRRLNSLVRNTNNDKILLYDYYKLSIAALKQSKLIT